MPRARARPHLPGDARHQLRAGRACDADDVHRVPAHPMGADLLGGVLRDACHRVRAGYRGAGDRHPARAAPLGHRDGHRHGRPVHPHRRRRQLDLGRRVQVASGAVRIRLVPKSAASSIQHLYVGMVGVVLACACCGLGAVPLHEARPRDAGRSAATGGGSRSPAFASTRCLRSAGGSRRFSARWPA